MNECSRINSARRRSPAASSSWTKPAWSPDARCRSCCGWRKERVRVIVLTGDTRQIQSVEAGDALRILEKESRLKSASLRSRCNGRRTAATGRPSRNCGGIPERGFERLEEIGAVREGRLGRARGDCCEGVEVGARFRSLSRLRHARRDRQSHRRHSRRPEADRRIGRMPDWSPEMSLSGGQPPRRVTGGISVPVWCWDFTAR